MLLVDTSSHEQQELQGVHWHSTWVRKTKTACRGPNAAEKRRENTAANDSNYGRLAAVA